MNAYSLIPLSLDLGGICAFRLEFCRVLHVDGIAIVDRLSNVVRCLHVDQGRASVVRVMLLLKIVVGVTTVQTGTDILVDDFIFHALSHGNTFSRAVFIV